MAEQASSGSEFHTAVEIWSRRKWLALTVFLTVLVVAVGVVAGLPSIYRATARVLVDRERVPEAFVRSAVTGEIETRLQSISQEVLGRARLEALIKQFNLYPDLQRSEPTEGVIEQMRRDIQLETKAAEQPTGRAATIAFNLSYRGTDRETVAAVTNALASLYVEENSKARERQASGTAQFLKTQLDEMKIKLEEQERRAGMTPRGMESDLASLERLNTRLRLNVDRQLRLMDRRERLVRETGGETGPAGSVATPDGAAARLSKLRQELAELRTRYTDKYPDIVRIKMEIATLEQRVEQMKAEAPPAAPAPAKPHPVADIDQESRALKAEEGTLRQAIATAEQRAEAAPMRLQEYQQRARDYATTKELYQSLLKRYEDAQIAENMEQGHRGEQFRVLDYAVPPQDSIAPNRLRLMILGLVAAFGLAIAAVMVAERFDTSFHTVDDLRSFTRLPVIGTIPALINDRVISARRRRFVLGLASMAAGVLIAMTGSYFFAHDNESLARLLSGVR